MDISTWSGQREIQKFNLKTRRRAGGRIGVDNSVAFNELYKLGWPWRRYSSCNIYHKASFETLMDRKYLKPIHTGYIREYNAFTYYITLIRQDSRELVEHM